MVNQVNEEYAFHKYLLKVFVTKTVALRVFGTCSSYKRGMTWVSQKGGPWDETAACANRPDQGG